jgi:hypothetical protein
MGDYFDKTYIEAPCNAFASQIVGPSGEQVYWAPIGSLYPVCPDGVDKKKLEKLFDKATLFWAGDVCPVDFDVYDAALESKEGLELLKKESFGEGIPFISISSMPLDENYFDDNYVACFFASKPFKMSDNLYITVGVIGL